MNITTRGVLLLCSIFLFSANVFSQTFGIGIDAPTATLDVRTAGNISSLNIQRTPTGSVGTNAAVEIRDASDGVVMEIFQNNFFNSDEVVYVTNAGTNNALFVSNGNTGTTNATARIVSAGNPNGNALDIQNNQLNNTTEVGYVLHSGLGIGLLVELSRITNPSDGIQVTHEGIGDGLYILMNNASGAQQGVDITHYGTGHGIQVDMENSPATGSNIGLLVNDNKHNQVGVWVDNDSLEAWGMVNVMWDGVGIYNDYDTSDGISVFTDMLNVDGSGYLFTNIDIGSLPTVTGSGDGFALDVYMNTASPAVGNTVYGAVVGGDQYGVGHGIILNHNGTAGRNAEFNITNSSNSSPAIFSVSEGTGSVIIGQQQNNSIGSTISVADFSYTGTESRDHVGVSGISVPTAGYGIGGYFQGGFYGVVGEASGVGSSAVHAIGATSATGTKSFVIDHPLDPENKILRHFSIESDEVLNMYRGVAVIGSNGKSVIELPEYFEAINRNFTYQLTSIGTPRQPWVVREIEGNRFVVGGKPGSKVSWTVLANRDDAYVKTHPENITPEVAKRTEDRGKYLDPESHSLPRSMGVVYRPLIEQTSMQRGKPKRAAEAMAKAASGYSASAVDPEQARKKYENYVVPEAPLYNTGEGERQQFERMEIRQEIKTWDEMH